MSAEMSSSKASFNFDEWVARFVKRDFHCEIHGESEQASSDSGKTYGGCIKCEAEATAKAEKEKVDAEVAAKELRDLKAGFAPKHEFIFYAHKGRSLFREKRISDVLEFPKIHSSGATKIFSILFMHH